MRVTSLSLAWPRGDQASLLGVSAVLGVVQLLMWVVLARHVPLSGDEFFYLSASKRVPELLVDAARLDAPRAYAALAALVGPGWFMPGMAVVLAPVSLVTDSIPVLRLYVGVLNFVLLCVLLRLLRDEFGGRAPLVYALCISIVPYYSIYAFTLWADLVGTHALLIMVLMFLRRVRTGTIEWAGNGPVFRFGLMLGALTYLRGFYWLLAPMFAVLLFLGNIGRQTMRERLSRLAIQFGVFAVGLAVVVAPWTLAVSSLHGFHLTVTSVTASRIALLGSRSYIEPIDAVGKRFMPVENHIRARAKETGLSYGDQARIERDSALSDLTFRSYAEAVAPNVGRFFLNSEQFLTRFATISASSDRWPGPEWRSLLFSSMMSINHWGWRSLLLVGIALMLVPVAPAALNLYLSVAFKYVGLLFAVGPFVVLGHGRHYVGFVPVIAVAVACATASRGSLLWSRPPRAFDDWLILVGQVLAAAIASGMLFGPIAFAP
ncbi:hypothetical protein PQJ75_17535 [Rhodoplanes sp. TEM]|uniref:Glycosyltransferase RgtA/B/C/D-like domain-containing protein n=1 Tax=Rhodoplanes tepidamans TaxID=200616 RepID=A0ABT5JD45_RHOTP|nr:MULTISPECIES: hypothetical protein [Rhodoplanes]MDC7787417.1 hypothetical protein [Rhodoplanes tepidamans]MDC7985536.1 hypothetical protein [Rhodoplanes sp. TEM]MDQ0358097.1 hypothetical protein [Rhodoplanes tepidamans]